MLTIRVYPGENPPKTDRSWLRECIKMNQEKDGLGKLPRDSKHTAGGRKPTMATGRTVERTLIRRRGNQGAPYKCPVLREKLWDWCVDVRRSHCFHHLAQVRAPQDKEHGRRDLGGAAADRPVHPHAEA